MIHGVYIKNRPKGKWLLVSTSASIETAVNDMAKALKQSKLDGNEQADVTIKNFESMFFIPESFSDIKKQAPQYN